MIPKFASLPRSQKAFARMTRDKGIDELTIVENPSYIYRPFDIYIMAPRVLTPRKKISAIVKDMDGTTTTTEELCVHSLEFMVGKICNLEKDPSRKGARIWTGFDESDHPNIIGNSTTKHVEYLIQRYGHRIDPAAFRRSYYYAALWTISQGRDPGRRAEVLAGLAAFGARDVLQEKAVRDFLARPRFDQAGAERIVHALNLKYREMPRLGTFADRVRAAIDVYYQRYHEILGAISEGRGEALSSQILHKPGAHLIEPMPGVAVFLAAVRGWLGEHLALFGEELKALLALRPRAKVTLKEMNRGIARLADLGRFFEKNPVPVAVVTSSIEYEAGIVLTEVFKILKSQAEEWPIPREKKKIIVHHFSDFNRTYHAFITASDSSEIRLKPHPDLYSLALHRMGIPREEFENVIGFEDSESGTRAIRTAGIGLCVALPFPFTKGHDLSAAAYRLEGGLPELVLKYSIFMDPKVLRKRSAMGIIRP